MNDRYRIRALSWQLRRLGVRRSPLRRSVDRLENVLRALAVVLTAAVIPLAVMFGETTYHRAATLAAEQTATRHPVTAVLLQASPSDPASYSFPLVTSVQARYTMPNGAVRTGPVRVGPGQDVGDRVAIWVDNAASQVDPPLTADQAYWRGWFIGGGLVIGVGSVLAALLGVLRWRFNRRRYTAWDAEWDTVEPRWTHRR